MEQCAFGDISFWRGDLQSSGKDSKVIDYKNRNLGIIRKIFLFANMLVFQEYW